MASGVRQATALESYASLCSILHDLSLTEVLEALELESASRRRKAIMCRLLRRAVRLNELEFKQTLIRKHFDGKTEFCGND